MRMPEFLTVGAMKSGTTALYQYLKQHPQIYMGPVRETRFFCLENSTPDFKGPGDARTIHKYVVTNIEDYQNIFSKARPDQIVGERCNVYLCDPTAAERIYAHIPQVKIIVLLRNPVERAYSNYLNTVRNGREKAQTFSKALSLEEDRTSRNWDYFWRYQQTGFYYEQLKRYYERFSPQQIRIYLYKDWKENNLAILKDIFSFIGVDESFVPKPVSGNVSYWPKSHFVNRFLQQPSWQRSILKTCMGRKRFKRWAKEKAQHNFISPPPLCPKIRSELTAAYREDIIALQGLISRDLSHWLQ